MAKFRTLDEILADREELDTTYSARSEELTTEFEEAMARLN